MSMVRVGWHFINPFVIDTHRGQVILTSTSPKQLKFLAEEVWRGRGAAHAAERLGLAGGSSLDASIAQSLLRPGVLPVRQRAALFSFLVNAVWTKHRLSMAGYAVPDTCCPDCQGQEDTMFHRLFECSRTENCRRCHFSDADWNIMRDPDHNWPLLAGFLQTPDFCPMLPEGYGHDSGFHFWSLDPSLSIQEAMVGRLYTDGSATRLGPSAYHVATWSVCAVSESGVLQASLSGSVGRLLPATSGAGETVAVYAAVHHCPRASELISDYLGICGIEDWPQWRLCNASHFHAGAHMLIRGHRHWGADMCVRKVKGHQDLSTLSPGTVEYRDASGNVCADRVAKHQVSRMRRPSQIEWEQQLQLQSTLRRFLLYVSEALLYWKATPKGRKAKEYDLLQYSHPGLLVGSSASLETAGPWARAGLLQAVLAAQQSRRPQRASTSAPPALAGADSLPSPSFPPGAPSSFLGPSHSSSANGRIAHAWVRIADRDQ